MSVFIFLGKETGLLRIQNATCGIRDGGESRRQFGGGGAGGKEAMENKCALFSRDVSSYNFQIQSNYKESYPAYKLPSSSSVARLECHRNRSNRREKAWRQTGREKEISDAAFCSKWKTLCLKTC